MSRRVRASSAAIVFSSGSVELPPNVAARALAALEGVAPTGVKR